MILNPIPWPNGASCAACLTFDIDADSLIHLKHKKDGYNRVSPISMLRYGPTVAIPRIVETYRRLGLHQTFFFPAWCMQHYPEAVETILKGGHEIAHHGYLHEHPNEQSLEEEAYWLDLGLDIHQRMTGAKPCGWRAPLYNFSANSLDLLLERGFSYDASLMGDDIPYVIKSRTNGGEMVEVPSHWGVDDWPQWVQSLDLDYMMPIRSPSHGFEVYQQEFDAARRYGGLWIPVIHPFATGRLSRWSLFSEFLERQLDKGGVWFAPMREIAAHVAGLIKDGAYKPRVELLPQYSGPVWDDIERDMRKNR
ncbi:polysaccharide deacetylase [Alphaproteobacteria bacterium]|nr:polysaccharide deacetylase [Alphaproteobacteria bacterium]